MRFYMRKIKGLRWYMIALVTLGTVLGYLTRNTVAAAPTLMEELHISTQQYSYIIAAYSAAYTVMQPVAGYVLIFWGPKSAMPSSRSPGRFSVAQRRWRAAGADWRWRVARSARRKRR
jgi:MFS family permease